MKIIDLRAFSGPYGCREPHIYAGRAIAGKNARPASPLANPFKAKRGNDAEMKTALAQYRQWLWQRIKTDDFAVVAAMREIKASSTLACWCVTLEGDAIFTEPEICHCQLIAKAWEYLQEKVSGWRQQN